MTLVRFYINKKEVSHSTASTQKDSPTILMFGNYPAGNQYFEGKMDDIRIYNRKLAYDEINLLFIERK